MHKLLTWNACCHLMLCLVFTVASFPLATLFVLIKCDLDVLQTGFKNVCWTRKSFFLYLKLLKAIWIHRCYSILYWVTLCWVSHLIYCFVECHCAECHYAECHVAKRSAGMRFWPTTMRPNSQMWMPLKTRILFQIVLAENVVEVLKADPRFSKLVSAVDKAGLVEILQGG